VSTSPSHSITNCPVLVVDDDEIARLLIAWVLKNAGFQVVSAKSGEEALDMVRARKLRIHLAIIDYNMGGIDGIQTFTGLRHLRPKLKAILYTGNPEMDQLRQRCPEGLVCLHKNFEREGLLSLIEDLIG
jgi:CheY-like chemotaxis protein